MVAHERITVTGRIIDDDKELMGKALVQQSWYFNVLRGGDRTAEAAKQQERIVWDKLDCWKRRRFGI